MNDITFVRTLQSVLYDNKYGRYVANRRTGKLNHKSLKKISFSDKLFKRKESREHKDYSIALVVDCSGSMDNNKGIFAFEAAQKLSKHLASAKINHAVYGFHTITTLIKGFSTAYRPEIKENLFDNMRNNFGNWSRKDKVGEKLKYEGPGREYYPKTRFLKEWEGSRRIIQEGAGYNNDPDALRYVAKQLDKENGTKIMIVLSDGQPALYHRDLQSAEFLKEGYDSYPAGKMGLKKVVSDILHSGIEVHSIGILTDAVNDYYPASRTCAIYDLSQLYDHIIKIIKLNLKRT